MASYNNEKAGSRFVKGRKQEALAEIEGWVGGSKEEVIKAGASKVASHPAKSITEQKMLDSYLYEMSKQRFNFIVQCQWQSKLFLQKQKRKTAVMRDLLRNVDASMLAENPFSVRRKTAAAEQRTMTTKSRRSLRSRSLPPIPSPSRGVKDDVNSTAENVFVTQKYPPSVDANGNNESDKKSSVPLSSPAKRSEVPSRDDWMWPVHDARYLRLNEILCENYPKVAHLQAKRQNLNLVAVATGQKQS